MILTFANPSGCDGPVRETSFDGGSMRVIHTPAAPSHTRQVLQAVEVGDRIHVSAPFGAGAAVRAVPDDARAEAGQLFAEMEVAAHRG
jgi:hypothetical protein